MGLATRFLIWPARHSPWVFFQRLPCPGRFEDVGIPRALNSLAILGQLLGVATDVGYLQGISLIGLIAGLVILGGCYLWLL